MKAQEQTAIVSAKNGDGMLSVASSREMQEVQAAIFLARQFPRDLEQVERKLMSACGRLGLAEQAMYAFPRGKELVTGPSIRLAEAIAQLYGNISFGIRELRQENGESIAQSYAWDMETNVRQEKIFTVPHKRATKSGTYALTDPRDIYELVANNGARRLRACILGIIPGDILEACIAKCEETVKKGAGNPLAERIASMVTAFDELGVSRALLEKRLRHKAETCNETEIMQLKKIYKSIADGVAKAAEYFDMGAPTAGAAADLNAQFGDDAGDARE